MMETFETHGISIPVDMRKSLRAKRISLSFGSGPSLRVTIPRRGSERAARSFMQEKARWVYKAYMELQRRQKMSLDLRFEDGGRVLFLGEVYSIRFEDGKVSSAKVSLEDDSLRVTLPEGSSKPQELGRSALERFYRQQAREVIFDSLSRFAPVHGFSYNRVTVRDQKTRWGSCSSSGNLNFSYRLVMAPLKVIDYIVVHELCHLKEMNHSKRFWDLVEGIYPSYREQEQWLKEKGGSLFLF